MRLQPIVYTTDTTRSVDWYSKVLGVEPAYSSEAWTSIPAGDASLGIHHAEKRPPASYLAISLVSNERLEDVVARLAEVGIHPEAAIAQQPFGRSVLLRDPDGAPVQINEHAN